MAIMVPEGAPSWGPGARAERALYEALRTGLPDDYFVYHHVPYLEASRAAQGEADFLILHRERGLLVLECKGYGVKRTGAGQWLRLDPSGTQSPLREGPFEQARRSQHELVRELRARLARALPRLGDTLPFIHGHAVAFPLTLLLDVNLPLDVDRRIVFDADDLAHLAERVEAAMRFWRAERSPPAPLSPADFKRFRKDVLHPATHLAVSIGARLRLDRDALVQLSEEQTRTLLGVLDNRRLRVRGGAGTGKTVVAVEAARTLAAEGKSVLLLCFNNALARHLAALVDDEDHPGAITARSFHQLCSGAFKLLGERPTYPVAARPGGADPADEQFFWNVEMAAALDRALAAKLLPRWDAIVVDEGQDLDRDWWPLIEDCLRDKASGSIAAFYDPAQNIFGRACHVPEHYPNFDLTWNFRNTRRIAEVVGTLAPSKMLPHPRAPEGEPVGLHSWEGPTKTLAKLEELVRKLIEKEQVRPDQIVLLTPHSRPNSLLQGKTELCGHPLADDPLHREHALLHTTIGRFKGLESDVVILADVDASDARCGKNERYVASSRACQVLHVFAKGDWLA